MQENISLPMKNSTHAICLFNAQRQLKELNFFDLAREEKLNDIQQNLECALEKWGKKIEKHSREDKLSLLERTIKSLVFYSSSFFKNDTHQEDQTKYSQNFGISNRMSIKH
ncbi:hypothetical protein [Rickettsiella endosymbiont of Rhagonycha lignosa]|uniref:hypothetical protein n=1 Tax=Rickettsiella endosymbiont of Rhagonycha lignosa TaxID=3077937 RepID=UPI00313BBA7D